MESARLRPAEPVARPPVTMAQAIQLILGRKRRAHAPRPRWAAAVAPQVAPVPRPWVFRTVARPGGPDARIPCCAGAVTAQPMTAQVVEALGPLRRSSIYSHLQAFIVYSLLKA